MHFEELKEIYLKSEADVITVIDFVNDVLKKIDTKFNLFMSIAFEKEITKYGKIIHVLLFFLSFFYEFVFRNQKEELILFAFKANRKLI